MTTEITTTSVHAMLPEHIAQVQALQDWMGQFEQARITTRHVFHAGMYARTITLPAEVLLAGVLIKRTTVLIVSGHCRMYTGGDTLDIAGYHVLTASAGRKQAYQTLTETHITMIFPTSAKTVEEAEREFTDDYESLLSHQQENHITITGE